MADCTLPTTEKEQNLVFRILAIGDSYVGKSCLLLKFQDSTFEGFVQALDIGFVTKVVQLDGRKVALTAIDTLGNGRYRDMITVSHYRSVDGIIIAYDVTDQGSFNRLGDWLEHIDSHARKNICKILIGCKCDLVEKRVVDYDTAKAFADQHGLQFFETSAKDGTNVEEAFLTIAANIMRCYRDDQSTKKTGWFSWLFHKS